MGVRCPASLATNGRRPRKEADDHDQQLDPFDEPTIDPLDAWKPIKVGEGCYIIDGPGDELIARLEVFVGGSEDDNDRAARVMAAAPLLLHELRRLVARAGMGAALDLDGAKAVIASCDGTSGRSHVNTTGPERSMSDEVNKLSVGVNA